MKVYGDPRSTNTRKVLVTLAELDTPYEFVLVEFAKREHKDPAHLQRQPFGQMPALDDEGFVLYETQAICRYLDAKAGYVLTPKDIRGRALVDQWMSIEVANFQSYVMKFVYHHLLKVEQDSSVLTHAAAQIEKTAGVLAKQLSEKPFVAGEAFTLADICFMPYVEYGLLTPAEAHIAKHPSVMNWWKNVRERPSWRKVSGQHS